MSSDRTDRLSKLAWEAQRRGVKGESALDKLQREAKAAYPAQWDEALAKAARRARRSGKVAYVVFAPTMHRAYARHAHQAGWYRRHHWPFSVHTNPHTTRATAPILWSTSEGYRVHYWTERRRSRPSEHDASRSARDPKKRRSKRGGWHGSFGVFYSKMRQQWTVLYSPKHHISSASVVGWYDTKEEAERVAGGVSRDPAKRHHHREAGAPTFKQQAIIGKKMQILERENHRRRVKRSQAQMLAIAYRYAGVPPRARSRR